MKRVCTFCGFSATKRWDIREHFRIIHRMNVFDGSHYTFAKADKPEHVSL